MESLRVSTNVDVQHPEGTEDALDQRKIFDAAVGNIVNIIVSYDMGWSKRGNGRSYNSLNGYGTIIGFLSGKVLDFAARNRKCKRCSTGHDKSDHDCRQNFSGSAKAMEPDVGATLVNDSTILKEIGLNVKVLIGDEDSSTIAAVRQGNPESVHKLTDANHLRKNFMSALYDLRKNFKEMRDKKVIPHLKKCFSYALAQNKGDSANLAKSLRNIPEHFFGRHENCGTWCKQPHKIVLQNVQLHAKLSEIFEKYAGNAAKFSIVASSQPNESFNNMMAHKTPKNGCYSQSEAADYRLASTVCTKNEGEMFVLNVNSKYLNLSPGKYTESFTKKLDQKRKKRAIKAKLPSSKARRNLLTQTKETCRKSMEKSEGTQYERNCGMDIDVQNSTSINVPLRNTAEDLPDVFLSSDDCNIIYFDLETSGLSKTSEILQIAAKFEDRKFSVYVNPSKAIDSTASRITGLKFVKGNLYFNGKKVPSMSPRDALESFQEFIDFSSKPCILVAHNVSFDSAHLLRYIIQNGMILNFQKIAGFSDSLAILRKVLPERKKENGMFKLETLARDFLKLTMTDEFHEALFDVDILEKLCHLLVEKEDFCLHCKPYKNSVLMKICTPSLKNLKGVVSDAIIKRIASAGFDFEILTTVYATGGEAAIRELLTKETTEKKPRVTKMKKIIDNIISHLQRLVLPCKSIFFAAALLPQSCLTPSGSKPSRPTGG
ncbi:uncharacterized protein LOC124407446 [Diprion similis]|uniref:uncharacterized protein LOC124407446 n=1 Tax=Diprion similis TaxID=362088 RepID=UPI001EF995D9|nr:uncharacterized protein LOC124407446 [Diprion similis]